jgi:hypothetical protein
LTLEVGYNITGGTDDIILIDPAVAFPTAIGAFTGAGSETRMGNWGPAYIAMLPIGPVGVFTTNYLGALTYIDGLEKADGSGTGANTPCNYGAGCVIGAAGIPVLGTLQFTLTGVAGVFDVSSVVLPNPFGTTIADNTGTSVLGSASLGTFTINAIPEPTTASLLGLGLVGLTVAGRRRES